MNHIMDVNVEFKRIIEEIEELKKEIVIKYNTDYYGQDARMVALDNIQLDLGSTGMWINAFNSLANKCMKNNSELDEQEFLNSVGSQLTLKCTEIKMIQNLVNGMITSVLFKIDNLFSNILRDWDSKDWDRKSYYKKCKKVINKTLISNNVDMSLDILTALANIRNSHHNNGIHKNEDLNIKIKNMDFSFTKGQPLEGISIEHLTVALGENINVLSQILLSDRVNWKVFIKDSFASSNTI